MKMFDRIRQKKWDLGIARVSEGHKWNSCNWDFHIIKAPRNCWYADPFILEVNTQYVVLLVEEFSYSIKRGRIAKLVIDKQDYKIKESKILLDLSTHLSFPNILRKGNRVYIYPENSESGNLFIYEYDLENDTLKPAELLCPHPLTDADYTEYFGDPLLFATQLPFQNKNILFVYKKDDSNKFVAFKKIILPDNTARGAGSFFVSDGMSIRPAQNCNNGYGSGLVFQNIEFINDNFEIRELLRVYPPKNYIGMHTYNQLGDYVVVDLHKERHPHLHRLFQFIKKSVVR